MSECFDMKHVNRLILSKYQDHKYFLKHTARRTDQSKLLVGVFYLAVRKVGL